MLTFRLLYCSLLQSIQTNRMTSLYIQLARVQGWGHSVRGEGQWLWSMTLSMHLKSGLQQSTMAVPWSLFSSFCCPVSVM